MDDLYIHQSRPVAAVQWTGHNFPAVEAFVAGWIGPADDTGARTSLSDGNEADGEYNMVQFYAWNDDQEVDPGQWIVVFRDLPGEETHRGTIMNDEELRNNYQPAHPLTADLDAVQARLDALNVAAGVRNYILNIESFALYNAALIASSRDVPALLADLKQLTAAAGRA